MNTEQASELVAAFREYAANTLVSNAMLSRIAEPDLRGVMFQALISVLERKIKETDIAYEETPASWWDATKRRWFPFLHYKTRTIVSTVKVKLVCPHLGRDSRDKHLEFFVWNREAKST